MIQCSLEACQIFESLGLLYQETVSQKRKAKDWVEEDYYDSDDDTFLDQWTWLSRSILAGWKKLESDDKLETYDWLIGKLNNSKEEFAEISELKVARVYTSGFFGCFMTEIKCGNTLHGVSGEGATSFKNLWAEERIAETQRAD